MQKKTENQFIVNLDGLKLSNQQRQNINAGIQQVVMKEIAHLDSLKDFNVLKRGEEDQLKFNPLVPPICGIWYDKMKNSFELKSNEISRQ